MTPLILVHRQLVRVDHCLAHVLTAQGFAGRPLPVLAEDLAQRLAVNALGALLIPANGSTAIDGPDLVRLRLWEKVLVDGQLYLIDWKHSWYFLTRYHESNWRNPA